MKKRLHVIADTSGSMSEMGKAYLLTNLMRGVSQLLYVQHDLSQRTEYIFWSWGASLKQLGIPQETSSCIHTQGSACFEDLQRFFDQEIGQYGECYVLLLSDGHFPKKDIDAFQAWLSHQTKLNTQVVSVSADADAVKLAKLSTTKRVYAAEQLVVAINRLFLKSKASVTAPRKIAELASTLLAETMDSQEDWE